MKANEVRNGNLVLDSSGNVREVDHADELGQSMWFKRNSGDYPKYYSSLDKCKPIPLTEEWLLKLGFHNGGYDLLFWSDGKAYLDGENIEIAGADFPVESDNDGANYAWNWYDSNFSDGKHGQIGIKYVHQLQNLYFALTGQELTVKENATA